MVISLQVGGLQGVAADSGNVYVATFDLNEIQVFAQLHVLFNLKILGTYYFGSRIGINLFVNTAKL